MSKQKKPLLTIGMIFRDDIRSLERCLRALQPLRDAVPCELIMADTGSIDGSREVAVRYADILFDFPWVDDFSAARNAVMDRASGQWYFTVDSDEYLDGDFSELIDFLQSGRDSYAMVVQRNYVTSEMDERYSDAWAGRLVCMSAGLRYQGRIHEHFPPSREQSAMLSRTILHHDGYVDMNEGTGGEKQKRNVSLLRASLAEEPENLRYLTQLIESGREEADWLEQIRFAAALVEAKKPGWQSYGPVIFRHAVFAARRLGLPELGDWISRAEDWFPDSYYTRIDVEHTAFIDSWDQADWADCVRRGERFLKAMEDYRSGGNQSQELLHSTLMTASPSWELSLRILLASACLRMKKIERAGELLEGLDGLAMDTSQAGNLAIVLQEFHAGTTQDTGPLLLRLYGELCQPVPSQELADARRARFLERAADGFLPAYQKQERIREGVCRPGCTLFLPLAGQCEIGSAAAILGSEDVDEIEQLLRTVERWEAFPVIALEHALQRGAAFPLADKPLKLEEMDALAAGMIREDSPLTELAVQAAERKPDGWQSMIWARELVLAAVQSWDWTDSTQSERLCRAFAVVSGSTLPGYYGAEVLKEETVDLLPPMHRFGWYCAQAFEALDSGNSTEYVRLLRAGLASCPDKKDMVEFLLQNLKQARQSTVPPELLALAEQVRTILSAYDPNDPAVTALKASPAYQKVAYLIEGIDGGGLPS